MKNYAQVSTCTCHPLTNGTIKWLNWEILFFFFLGNRFKVRFSAKKICLLHLCLILQFHCVLICWISFSITVFSSPEPKAHRWAYSIGRRRPSNIFKHLLWSREADSYQISHIASIGRGNKYCCCLFQSDKNSGCYSFHWLIMGKVEISNFCCLTTGI